LLITINIKCDYQPEAKYKSILISIEHIGEQTKPVMPLYVFYSCDKSDYNNLPLSVYCLVSYRTVIYYA
jgi:hypothetical protein